MGPRTKFTLLAMGFSSLLLAGCATTASNQALGDSGGLQTGSMQQSRWIVGDDAFNRKLTFVESRTRDKAGFLEAQVTVRNVTAGTVEYETMFEWFDAQGFKVDNPVELWKPGLIYGEATQEIRAIAPSRSAASFRFHIRRSNPIT